MGLSDAPDDSAGLSIPHVMRRPRGKVLRPTRSTDHGRFFYSHAKDCRRCSLSSICLSKGRANRAIVISDDYPALLRARRRRDRWSDEELRLYQRHGWRSEGFHGRPRPGTDSPELSAVAWRT